MNIKKVSPSIFMVATKLLEMVPLKIHLHSSSNTIISRSRTRTTIFNNGSTQYKLRYLQRNRASSIDSFSLLHALKDCIKTSSFPRGKQIHGLIINLGFGSIIFLQTTLIKMYAAMGHLEDAHSVFNEISPRSVICWTCLISAYVDNGKPSKALNLLRQMQMESFEPDRVTLTVALSACADLGALEMGEWIHAYISRKQGFKIDLPLTNALINMYSKCGDVGTSRQLFNELDERDIMTWTSMIVGHAVHGQAEEALRLFCQLKDNNDRVGSSGGYVIPNEVTFVGVLMACSHAGLLQEGLRHLESMSKDYSLKPRLLHYGCIVDLLCRAGLLKEAYAFVTEMPIQPNAVIWRTLLVACSKHGNIQLGEHVRNQLLELEPDYVGDGVVLSNMYAAAGLWNDKSTVRNQIKHRRAPGCSLIEVERKVHEFVAADKNHPRQREIYSTLEAVFVHLTTYGYSVQG